MTHPPRKKKSFLKFLTVCELNKLNTKRLLGVLKSVRSVEDSAKRKNMSYGVCCEVCNEWVLGKDEFEKVVVPRIAHLTAYKNRIKKILSTRENVK